MNRFIYSEYKYMRINSQCIDCFDVGGDT